MRSKILHHVRDFPTTKWIREKWRFLIFAIFCVLKFLSKTNNFLIIIFELFVFQSDTMTLLNFFWKVRILTRPWQTLPEKWQNALCLFLTPKWTTFWNIKCFYRCSNFLKPVFPIWPKFFQKSVKNGHFEAKNDTITRGPWKKKKHGTKMLW